MKSEINKYSFGKFVREKREQKGISLRSLANLMHISPSYLSDVENGFRAAPLKAIKGKNRMADLINFLDITNDELPKFYELAYATRTSFPDIDKYLASNPKAMNFIRIAMETNLPDDEWEKFTATLISLKDNHYE